jgi:hypothetical protein
MQAFAPPLSGKSSLDIFDLFLSLRLAERVRRTQKAGNRQRLVKRPFDASKTRDTRVLTAPG